MARDQKTIYEGYHSGKIDRGYQPEIPEGVPTTDPNPQGGYQPESQGDNPSNPSPPPGDE